LEIELTFQGVKDGHGTTGASSSIARDFDLVGRCDFFNRGSGLFSVRLRGTKNISMKIQSRETILIKIRIPIQQERSLNHYINPTLETTCALSPSSYTTPSEKKGEDIDIPYWRLITVSKSVGRSSKSQLVKGMDIMSPRKGSRICNGPGFGKFQ
jgi:hypothetical protein